MEHINNIASVLGIISAAVTLISALKIKAYYERITTMYSIEKLAVAEEKAIEAKSKYQELKEMYFDNRGRTGTAYSKKYMEIDSILDEVMHSLPSEYSEICEQIKSIKAVINEAMEKDLIEKRSQPFLDLGTILDALYNNLKSQKTKKQERNAKSSTRK